VIITNEEDALQPLRRAARDADTPAPVDRLSLVLNGVIPAVKKFTEAIGEDSEMALFIGDTFCWFFGNHGAIRAMIPESQSASEITYYRTARDFGPITIARDSGKTTVRIAGVPGTDSIELEASGDTGALEAVIPFLFGRGGSAAEAAKARS